MAKSKGRGHVNRIYKRDGFGGVWRWAKGRGLKPWIRARNWARFKAKHARDPEGFKKAQAAYAKRAEWWRKHKREQKPKPPSNGGAWATFDNHTCCRWIADILSRARQSGIWDGYVLSGVRTPAQSIALCRAMCGADSCAGRCAGATSNHNATTCAYPQGAVDVTDPAGLEAYCRSHSEKLYGNAYALPYDQNHFSATGR